MTTPIEIAIGQLGVAEDTGKNDGVPAERYMAGDRLPWCAGFVMFCFKQAGRTIEKDRAQWYAMRNVENLRAELVQRSLWRCNMGYVPVQNDIVFFSERGASDVLVPSSRDTVMARHVAIVEDVDGSELRTIDGNWTNRVCRVSRSLSSPLIMGYARVTG